jgi:hypothetical protein
MARENIFMVLMTIACLARGRATNAGHLALLISRMRNVSPTCG